MSSKHRRDHYLETKKKPQSEDVQNDKAVFIWHRGYKRSLKSVEDYKSICLAMVSLNQLDIPISRQLAFELLGINQSAFKTVQKILKFAAGLVLDYPKLHFFTSWSIKKWIQELSQGTAPKGKSEFLNKTYPGANLGEWWPRREDFDFPNHQINAVGKEIKSVLPAVQKYYEEKLNESNSSSSSSETESTELSSDASYKKKKRKRKSKKKKKKSKKSKDKKKKKQSKKKKKKKKIKITKHHILAQSDDENDANDANDSSESSSMFRESGLRKKKQRKVAKGPHIRKRKQRSKRSNKKRD